MKKFFKALALVLALTLVIGTIPASAATEIKPDESKTLYAGGTKGVDASGTKSAYKQKASYASLLNISKDEVISLKIKAVSSDTDVVKCYNKREKKRIRANGIGEATITFTDKNGETYTVPVTVKKSASEETVRFGQDFKDVKDGVYEAETGKDITVSVPVTKDGKKLDTDKRRLVVKDADGNDVTSTVAKAVEGKARLWTLNFAKAGEYKVIAQAYQSEKYIGTTAETSITVKVTGEEEITTFTAKGTAAKEITVWAGKDAKFTDKTKFTVTRGEKNVSVSVAKTTFKEEYTKAVLTLDSKMVDDEYTVTDGTSTSTFTGKAQVLKSVIILENETAVKSVLTNEDSTEVYVHYQVKDN